jgi:hypothetical protein
LLGSKYSKTNLREREREREWLVGISPPTTTTFPKHQELPPNIPKQVVEESICELSGFRHWRFKEEGVFPGSMIFLNLPRLLFCPTIYGPGANHP